MIYINNENYNNYKNNNNKKKRVRMKHIHDAYLVGCRYELITLETYTDKIGYVDQLYKAFEVKYYYWKHNIADN